MAGDVSADFAGAPLEAATFVQLPPAAAAIHCDASTTREAARTSKGTDKSTASDKRKLFAILTPQPLRSTFKRTGPTEPVERRRHQLALPIEEVVDDRVGAQEPLPLRGRTEAANAPLPGPGRLVRQLRPVVRLATGVVDRGRHQFPAREAVAA